MPLQVPVTQTGLEASIQQAMKNAGRNAQINLGTNSRQINALAQPLGRITGQADEFTKSMEAANARVFAFGASVGIINGVTKAFSSLVKNTIEVEKSLVEINTVLNASGDSLQKFGNKLFDVAKTTGQTFDVVAKGALELARQGLSTEETLKRINDALILSRLSGLDAQQSVEGLTAAFNSFKETGITTSQILNKLVVVSQKYSVSERDLIEGLKRSASVADQAGVSFDELVGIITTVQERTARGGAVIGNAFKTIFARIQDTGALQDLANLGIQITDLEGKVLPATRILQNLGAEFNNLSQLEQADIAKKLGGVYQLSNLLAAVKDLSSEQSKYNDIVKLSAGATNEAYQKNAALNETLAALINKVSVSAQQLGATLGAIGITDNLKQLLDFFNNILEGIQKILGEESAMGTFVRGLAKGIGNVLAGPGLILFGAIIAKLSKDLIAFGVESLKSFFKIGQSAKEIASVEKAIAAALGSNLTLQKQLFALEGNRAAQIKLMTDAIVQQEAVMRKMATTAGSLAGPLYQQGVRSTGGQGLRVPQAAGGYMPAVSQETRDINRGVGGAKASDKPVILPNFAFGGGKKGTMVAHTGEYIVPNFAGGGSAIFNRDMVRSMGLPAGAKKIGAAGGFIPNFAEWYNRDTTKVKTSNSMPTTPGDWVKVKSNSESIRKYSENIDQYRVRDTDFYLFPDGTGSRGNAVRATLGREVSKGTINKQKAQAKEEKFGSFTLDANQLGGILVVSPRFGAEGIGSLNTKLQAHEIPLFNYDSAPPIDKNKFIKLNNLKTSNTPKPQNVQGLQGDISQLFAGGIVDLAYRLYGGTFDPASAGEFSQKLKSLDPSKKEQLIPPAAQGSLFEAAGKVALNSFSNLESLFGSGEENRPFDFQNATAMQKMFGVSVGRGEAKRGDEKNFTTSKQITGIVKKVFNDPEYSSRALDALEKQGAFSPEMQRKKSNEEVSNAINGFIPNFSKRVPEKIRAGRDFESDVFAKLKLGNPGNRTLDIPEGLLTRQRIEEAKTSMGLQGSFGDVKLSNAKTNKYNFLGKLIKYFNLANYVTSAFKDKGQKEVSLNKKIPSINDATMFFSGNPSLYYPEEVSATLGQILHESRGLDGVQSPVLEAFKSARAKPGDPSSVALQDAFKRKRIVAKINMDGINPYQNTLDDKNPFAKGYIPNFVDETLQKEISKKSGSDLYLKDGVLKVGFLRSRNGNPLFEIARLINENKIKEINAGAIIGPKIPDLIVGLRKMIERKRLKDPSFPRIKITGHFRPQKLAEKISEQSEYKYKQKHGDLLKYYTKGYDYYGKKDQKNFVSAMGQMKLNRKDDSFVDLRELYPQGFAQGYIPNFAVDLTKSRDYIENQRKRNFKAGTYRKATGAIGSLFKSLPEKFFADGVLGDGAQGLETNGIFNLIKQNALYGASFAGPKAVKFVTEAEKYGLKVEKSLKDKLAKLVVKGASKIKGYSGGFLPNFADPLKEAIGREMSAGVPASQIYVDQNSSLKNSMNPMGLMVANRRDEPGGGMQGVSRARKEGANPMMYGAADGFIPNYAVSKIGEVTKNNSNLAFGTSNQQIASFNKGLENITVGLRNGSIKFNEAMSQVSKLASATGQNTTQVKKLESAGKSLMGAYNSELTIRNQKAQELKKQRVNSSMGPAAVGTAGSKAPRDLLGTVFAVQAGLSLLTGATEGATSELGKYTNIVSGGIGTATSTLFAFQGLSAALPKFAGFLGPAGIAVSAATAAFQIGKDIMLELSGANKGAAQNSALLAKAAQSAATRLDELNPVTQAKVKQSAKDIQYNLEKGLFTKKGEYIEPPVAKNRGESLTPEFQKKIKEYRVKIGEDLSPEDINKYREKFEKAKKEAEKIGKPVAKNRAEASSPEFQKKLMEYRKATDKKSYYEDALTKARESGGTVKVKLAGVSPDDEKNYQDALLNARASGLGASTIAKTVLDEAKKTNGKEEGELYTDNIEEIIKKLGELSKNPDFKRIKQDIDDIFSFEDLSFAPIDDIFKGIAVKIKDGSLGAKEQEDLIQNLTKTIGNREVAEDLVVGAIERGKKALEDKNNAQAQANAGISKQVKETLKLLKVQQSIDARKRGEAAVSKSAELANLQQSLAISSDLSLSETQRATASAKLETAYSRVTKELEAAAQIGDELDNVIKNFSDESEKITTNLQPDQIKNGIEKAKVAMDSFGKSADEAKLIANAIAEGGIKGGAAYEKLAGVIKEKLSPEFAAIPEAVDLAVQGTLNLNSAREKILTTLNDEIYSMQRLADLNLKVKQIEEDRKNIVEKVNYNLEGRASALSYQASQISNTTSLNQAKKELETTIYQRTATTTSPESYKQGLDEINKKYFDLEQAATLRKAEIEAKADLIRNNKVDENSIKIGYNTTAINDFYTLLKNDIKTLLQQMPGNIKTAIEQAEPQQSQSNTASTNSTSSPALNQGNQTIPYLLRRPQETSSTGSVEAAANNIRNIEIPTLNVNQAISQSTIQQTGYIDKQASIAKTLSSLSIEEINSGALTAAKDLAVQYGKSNTEVTQIAEGIKTMAITLKEAKDSFNLENETQQINDAVEELNKMPKGFASTFSESIRTMKTETAFFQDRLGETIPTLFADNLAQGIQDAVTGAKSLEDALLNAASSFVSEIQSMAIKNLANTFTSSIFGFSNGGEVKKYASGGMINGGSGAKDDVPAMLMGGEYVVKKTAVQKYGPEFLDALNNGRLNGYAKGGKVQSGAGGFYIPGTYGQGGIQGRQNLLDFATQSATSGQYDVIQGGENYASINLEGESVRLTNWGRQNSAQADEIKEAKGLAFDLYEEDVRAWEDYYDTLEEIKKSEKEQKKAFWTSLAISAASSVASSAASSIGQGFKAGWSNAASQTGSTFSSKLSGGISGAFGGATVDGVKVGGLSNWFSGVGSALTGNFKQAGNYFNLSQISSSEGLQKAYASSIENKSSFSPFLQNQGYIPKETVVGGSTGNMQQTMGSNGIMNWSRIGRKATGGIIPATSGIDTVPTMLSGGEFIMNRAASQNIGAGNLQSLNSGASSLPTEEKTEELNNKLIAKLDELIIVMTEGGGSGSITINVDQNANTTTSTTEVSGESSKSRENLAKQIKDTVIQVIEQEKRLGGKLRRGL